MRGTAALSGRNAFPNKKGHLSCVYGKELVLW